MSSSVCFFVFFEHAALATFPQVGHTVLKLYYTFQLVLFLYPIVVLTDVSLLKWPQWELPSSPATKKIAKTPVQAPAIILKQYKYPLSQRHDHEHISPQICF